METDPTEPTIPAPRPRRPAGLWRPGGGPVVEVLAAVVVVAAVVGAAVVSGSVDGSNTTLQIMGFDPDRAQLISSLLVGAVAAAVAVLLKSRVATATLLGCLGAAALFGPTFVSETRSALSSTGVDGSFDLAGWLITLLTLIVSGIVAGWAGAILAGGARPAIYGAVGVVAGLVRRRPVERRAARRAVAVVLFAVVLAVTVPVFGDLVNYSPDARMIRGGPPLQGLVGPVWTPPPGLSGAPSPLTGVAGSPAPSASGSGQPAASASGQPTASPSPTPNPQPWLAWRPSGSGSVTTSYLPAPWKGVAANLAEVTVYTPPGYAARGTRRYPVLYQAPYTFAHWDAATNVNVVLDALIDRGAIPPMIVVSMSADGGPYADSECANSYDGSEWFDRYTAQTVVPWVDSHYRTIAEAAARAIMGSSQGGYCAAILALHHPQTFGSSLVYSGYFHAAIDGGGSYEPFGGNAAALAAASPDIVAGQLDPSVRSSLYFILTAEPGQKLYGPEAARFDQLLTQDGYPHLVIPATVPHGWVQVRHEFPAVTEAWAARLVTTGVFDTNIG
jgi:enterochelin esterase-like enzyme